MNKYNDLRNALSELLLGVPYDPETTHPENFKIAHLVTVARAYGMGDADLDDGLLWTIQWRSRRATLQGDSRVALKAVSAAGAGDAL